jgi:transcriptional regulator with XRE-family HTH domain
MKLNDHLATARAAVGISLRELERKTGISNALLSQYETGHIEEPSFRNVVKIARALDVPLLDLAKAK